MPHWRQNFSPSLVCLPQFGHQLAMRVAPFFSLKLYAKTSPRQPSTADAPAMLTVPQAAAGDVRQPLDDPAVEQAFERAEVAAVRLQQLARRRGAQLFDVGVGPVAGDLEHQLARQAVAVRVQAYGRQRQQHVARSYGFTVDDARAVNDADDEACDVVFA